MKRLLAVRLVLMLFVFGTGISGCSHVFYQPSRQLFFEPQKLGFQNEDIAFPSRDGTPLHAWYFRHEGKGPSKGTFVQFHGNAENISTFFRALAWVTSQGYDLFIFDYRGYGRSAGEPSQEGINHDGVAALKFAFDTYYKTKKTPKLIVYGQSLGGAIALRALPEFFESAPDAREAVGAVVIDSSFMNYKKIAAEKLSNFFLTWPFQWMAYLAISNAYSPEDHIAKISPTPLLVIHGDKDQTVPMHHGKKIYEIAQSPKTFWEIKNGDHIDAMWGHKGIYRKSLLQYLNEVTR